MGDTFCVPIFMINLPSKYNVPASGDEAASPEVSAEKLKVRFSL